MLGLEPRGNRLTVDACLAPEMEWLEVRGLRGRWGVIDAVGRRSTPVPKISPALLRVRPINLHMTVVAICADRAPIERAAAAVEAA